MTAPTPMPPGPIAGPYDGIIASAFDQPGLRAWLADLASHVVGPDAVRLSTGRNETFRVSAVLAGDSLDLVVKRFGGQRAGHKAVLTWAHALYLDQAGIGTPTPVAWLQRRNNPGHGDFYVITRFASSTTSFARALSELYAHDAHTERFMTIMQPVASEIRRMHDAGFVHNDLGNQNILLQRTGTGGWSGVQFIDLNRGRIIRQPLSLRHRARDLSRVALPSDLMRVFIHMYWGDTPPPPALSAAERRYRARYQRHHRSRKWRHPWREYRLRQDVSDPEHRYPRARDIWIWDERSGQALTVWCARDRRKLYPAGRHATAAGATIRAFVPVWRRYKQLLEKVFAQPVDMCGRIGISLEPTPERWPHERVYLDAVSARPVPVLMRFYHHAGGDAMRFRARVVRELHAAGHQVAIALVQDRRAVLDPDAWARFLAAVLEATAPHIHCVEVTHALNRVKWGIWDFREFRALMQPVVALAEAYPNLDFMGPAAIDFEYMYVLGALASLPPNLHLHALSHLLYVDRRGAPEQEQSGFSTLEKTALIRAIAAWSPRCADRLVISEVNWPLAGAGVFSPVGAPYVTPGPRTNDPSVGEQTYACYMIRYLLITLCSGLAERVYWWRLAAHGFGLVDDGDAVAWRPRPAFQALRTLLDRIGDARFIEVTEWPHATARIPAYGYWFRRRDGREICVAFAPEGRVDVPVIPGATVSDMFGQPLREPGAGQVWLLSEQPLYITCA